MCIRDRAPTDISSTLRTLPGVDIVDKQPSMRGGSGWTYGVGARSHIIVYHLGFSGIPLNTVNIVVIIHDKTALFYNISLNFEKLHNLASCLAVNS